MDEFFNFFYSKQPSTTSEETEAQNSTAFEEDHDESKMTTS